MEATGVLCYEKAIFVLTVFQVHENNSLCKELFIELSKKSAGKKAETGKYGKAAEKRLFLSNIPYHMNYEQVKDVFKSNGCPVLCCEMFKDRNQCNNGSAILEFESSEAASNAIQIMNGYQCFDRKLVVKEDFIRNKRDEFGQIITKRFV